MSLRIYKAIKGTVSRESHWTGWAKLEGNEGGDGEGASGGVWDSELQLYYHMPFKRDSVKRINNCVFLHFTGWAKLEGDEGGDGEGAIGGLYETVKYSCTVLSHAI